MYNISKEQFDTACNNHQPNAWVKFGYKYFSKETESKNKGLANAIFLFLAITFLIGFLSVAFNFPIEIVKYSTYAYCIVIPLVAYLFSIAMLNNIRIKKIIKELGITEEQYSDLSNQYA